jgi:uncharacterized membrane protein YoaK (UPF0700 family)
MTMFKAVRNRARFEAHGEASREPSRPARHRDALVVVLALTTGALDAVSYLRLGKVFSSVITGNLALLGVATGKHDAVLALNAGLALAGYACGVLVGGAFAGTPERGQPTWPSRVTFTLTAELSVLAAFSGEWLVTGGHAAGASRPALLLLGAAAMGMQSTAVRRLGPMSTTYLTSTLTGILTALAVRRWPAEWQRSSGVLLAAVMGATLGGLAALWSPHWVPAAILIPIATVLAASTRLARSRLPAVSPRSSLAPVSTHLDHDGRHAGHQQRSDEDDQSGGTQRGALHHCADNNQDQAKAAAGCPEHGYPSQPGIDTRRLQAARQLDQLALLGQLSLQLTQPASLVVRHRHARLRIHRRLTSPPSDAHGPADTQPSSGPKILIRTDRGGTSRYRRAGMW